jgi:AAA15 family ATPase/GTPase
MNYSYLSGNVLEEAYSNLPDYFRTPGSLNERTSGSSNERTYEQFISERSVTSGYYSNVFEKIKDKLFVLDDLSEPTLNESEFIAFNNKYQIGSIKETIGTFKTGISELYVRKTELEIGIDNKKELYKTFCEDLNKTIKNIEKVK